MKNLRDALREYTKRQVKAVRQPKQAEKREETRNAAHRPLSAQHNDRILENAAAQARKELVKRSSNESFWHMHKNLDENEAASLNMLYEFHMQNRSKKWSMVETRRQFDLYIERISVVRDIMPRIKKKREEKIDYSNMAHQAYKGV